LQTKKMKNTLQGTENTLKNYEDKELPPFVART
jgi:hypothetical protein